MATLVRLSAARRRLGLLSSSLQMPPPPPPQQQQQQLHSGVRFYASRSIASARRPYIKTLESSPFLPELQMRKAARIRQLTDQMHRNKRNMQKHGSKRVRPSAAKKFVENLCTSFLLLLFSRLAFFNMHTAHSPTARALCLCQHRENKVQLSRGGHVAPAPHEGRRPQEVVLHSLELEEGLLLRPLVQSDRRAPPCPWLHQLYRQPKGLHLIFLPAINRAKKLLFPRHRSWTLWSSCASTVPLLACRYVCWVALVAKGLISSIVLVWQQ